MKKLIFAAITALAMHTFGQAYELVNDPQGYSYIKINEDLASFSFKSDFKSIGNSGKVGFFIYPEDLSGEDLKKYISLFPADSAIYSKSKDEGNVELGAKKSGDRIGFYLNRNNGDIIRLWNFEEHNGVTYIAFDKNNGTGKDEWMSIEGIATHAAENPVPAGAPLTNTFYIIFAGGLVFALAYKYKALYK